MKPLDRKILIKFIETNTSAIQIVSADGKAKNPNSKEGDFFIEKLGKDCNVDLKVGQKITMREHHYKINVTTKEQQAKDKSAWYFLIDESEVWGVEDV